MLTASVDADLVTRAGQEAITTATQVCQFAISRGWLLRQDTLRRLTEGLADKGNSLGHNRQAQGECRGLGAYQGLPEAHR